MQYKLSSPIFWYFAVLAGAIVSFVLAIIFSTNQSIWFDEGYSILLAKSSWTDLFSLTAVDAHPPLYYVLLKIWALVFGYSEFALRAFSIAAFSAAIIGTALLLKKMFTPKIALLALPIIVAAPFIVRYGYEVRMYALAMLISVAATYALITAYQTKKRLHWAVYAVLVAAGMYTLYMTIVVWLAHLAWLLIQDFKKSKRAILNWQWLYAYAGAVLLFVPYLSTFIYQLSNSALPGIGSEVTLTKLVDIITTLLIFRPEWGITGWLSLLIILGLGLATWALALSYRYFTSKQKLYYSLLGLLVLVPLIFYAFTSLPPRQPIFVNRYLAHVAIFIYTFLSVTLAISITKQKQIIKWGKVPLVAYIVILLTLIFGLITLQGTGNFVFERMQHPQTKQLRSTIACNNQTTIVADDAYTYIDSVFYFNGCNLTFYSPKPIEKKGGYAPLHNSNKRIDNPSSISTPVIIRLGWNGKEANFKPDSRYKLVRHEVFDKQLVEFYSLSGNDIK